MASFPSKYQDLFLNSYYDKIIGLCKRIDVKYGNICIQMMYVNNKFYILELLHRLDGVGTYKISEELYHFNALEHCVDYALGIKNSFIRSKNSKYKVGGILHYWANPGIVEKIIGVDEINKMEDIKILDSRYNVGDKIEKTGSMLQMAFQVALFAEDKSDLLTKVKKAMSILKIYDENDNELTDSYIPIDNILNS